MANQTRTTIATLLASLSLAVTGLAQQIEIQGPPGVMLLDGAGDGEIMFEGDGPMLMIGGPDGGGLGEFIGGAAAGGSGVYSFPVSASELERFARILRFSPEQTAAGTTLLDGYTTAFKLKADDARNKAAAIREEAKENEERNGWLKTIPITKDLQTERDRVEAAFLADFKSLADAEQAKRWDKVEMYRRRAKAMRTGGFAMGPAGSRVDLTAVVDSLKLPAESQTKLESILDSYERDIDARLAERAAAQVKQREAMKEAARNKDFSILSKFDTERYDAGVKMRDANRGFAAQIVAVLPKEQADRFDLAFRKAVYPRIYRERYAAKAMAAAAALDDLTDAQRKGLAALKERYERNTNDLCRRAETAAQAAEQAAHEKEVTQTARGGENGVFIHRTFAIDDDASGEQQRNERRELEDGTVKALIALLSPAQAERLPTRPGTVIAEEGPRTTTHPKTR